MGMEWQDKRVLVTGGGGFLGRYIVERLLELNCKKIRSLGRSPQPELEALGVDVICGDIADQQIVSTAAEGCDIVFQIGTAKYGVCDKEGNLVEFPEELRKEYEQKYDAQPVCMIPDPFKCHSSWAEHFLSV